MEEPLPTQLPPGPPEPPPSDWSRLPGPTPTPTAGFGVGVFLSETFRAWLRSLPAFAVLGIAAAAPMAFGIYRIYSELPALVQPNPVNPFEQMNGFFDVFWRWWVIALVAMSFELAAVTYGALGRLRGEKAGFGAMLAAGFRRGPAVLGVLVLVTLAMIPAACLFFVPTVILGCAWAASVPAAVVERANPVRALARSWELTGGHRLPIFLGFLILLLGTMLAAMLVQGITFGLFSSLGGSDLSTPAGMALPMSISQLVAGMLNTLTATGCASAYHRLYLVKGGGDPVHLANVFE